MNKLIIAVAMLFLVTFSIAQPNLNLEMVANISIGEDGNDIWGYVDANGLEYAVMGTKTATRIWSLEDPANPIERAVIDGTSSIWRDIKHFEDHLYVTTDQGKDGLLIIDMSLAPDSISYHYWKPEFTINGTTETLEKCHNLYIDPEEGYCYLSGCNISAGGIMIFDLNQDKELPVFESLADIQYSHDVYTKGDRMYTSEIYIGEFNVYDISDKTNPILLNGAETSMNFCHNAWASDDQNYVFTTDERANAWVDAFDISDLDDIKFLDRFQSIETAGTDVIPHNTHYLGGMLITSWYTDGVVVIDATKPDNLIKVAAYDTETVITSGFDGCWGAYPYLPSGLILASDINHGLFIFQPKEESTGTLGYARACYLEGEITDKNTGSPISNVKVEILSQTANDETSSVSGEYKTGQVQTGTFDVVFSHPNYDPITYSAILTSGEVTILNAELGNVVMQGTVKDAITEEPIVSAMVVVENVENGTQTIATTDDDGNWSVGSRENESYTIYAAIWGHKGESVTIDFTDIDEIFSLSLTPGYNDDFFADLGWTTGGTASTGLWEVANAEEKLYGSSTIIQPGNDTEGDLGNSYFVTGKNGGGAGEDDVDDGTVTILSPPLEMVEFNEMAINFKTFFANLGGNSTPNDYLKVEVTNGTETFLLTEIVVSSGNWSEQQNYTITSEDISFNNDMRILVTAADDDPGHVVEAGFDAFNAIGSLKLGTTVPTNNISLSVSPNPATNYITLSAETMIKGKKTIVINDIHGKVVKSVPSYLDYTNIDIKQLTPGMYSLRIIGDEAQSETVKFIKVK
ncbi:MAG: choice-of-anchor B family protein [Saprospiraceae bacterium]